MEKLLLFATAAAGIGATVFAQTAAAPPEPALRMQTSFDLLVHASYAETAPLFGPEGERAWAGKHWDPQFLYPVPAHDEEGAVFTVHHDSVTASWVNTLFDVEARRIQYVYFIAGVMVTVIDVRFNTVDDATTNVRVTYTRTALSPAGSEHVKTMSEGDRRADKEWQQAIDAYLAGRKH